MGFYSEARHEDMARYWQTYLAISYPANGPMAAFSGEPVIFPSSILFFCQEVGIIEDFDRGRIRECLSELRIKKE